MSIVGANNIISIYRLVDTNNKSEYSSTAVLGDVECYLEPLSPEVAAIFGDENAFTTFKCYIEDAHDIVVSDKIVDQNSAEYIVNGVQKYEDNIDTSNQTELTIVKKYT